MRSEDRIREENRGKETEGDRNEGEEGEHRREKEMKVVKRTCEED